MNPVYKCVVCGVGAEGFSFATDEASGQKKSVWNNCCSYGCTISVQKYKSVYM
jgi:hypothetical protein